MANLTEFPDDPSIPAGEHVVRVKKAEEKKSKEKQIPMWMVTFEDAQGREMPAWYMLTPAFAWKLKRLVRALGFSDEDMTEIRPGDIVGKSVRITVVEDETRGRRDITKEEKIAVGEELTEKEDDPLPF